MKSHKFAGALISIVVVIVVAFITFYEERARSSLAVASTVSPADVSPVSQATASPAAPVASQTPLELPPSNAPAATPAVTAAADVPKQTASIYKDGTYTATGSYMSPGGYDQITVTLIIANGIVTDATVVSGAGDGTSQRYQDRFIAGYKPLVIGKDIATLNVSRVSGSSLTPIGFNDAVAQIKTAAKS